MKAASRDVEWERVPVAGAYCLHRQEALGFHPLPPLNMHHHLPLLLRLELLTQNGEITILLGELSNYILSLAH